MNLYQTTLKSFDSNHNVAMKMVEMIIMSYNDTFHFLSALPPMEATLAQGLSEYFFKGASKTLNPSDSNFKGADSQNLRCWNLTLHRGLGGG